MLNTHVRVGMYFLLACASTFLRSYKCIVNCTFEWEMEKKIDGSAQWVQKDNSREGAAKKKETAKKNHVNSRLVVRSTGGFSHDLNSSRFYFFPLFSLPNIRLTGVNLTPKII